MKKTAMVCLMVLVVLCSVMYSGCKKKTAKKRKANTAGVVVYDWAIHKSLVDFPASDCEDLTLIANSHWSDEDGYGQEDFTVNILLCVGETTTGWDCGCNLMGSNGDIQKKFQLYHAHEALGAVVSHGGPVRPLGYDVGVVQRMRGEDGIDTYGHHWAATNNILLAALYLPSSGIGPDICSMDRIGRTLGHETGHSAGLGDLPEQNRYYKRLMGMDGDPDVAFATWAEKVVLEQWALGGGVLIDRPME